MICWFHCAACGVSCKARVDDLSIGEYATRQAVEAVRKAVWIAHQEDVPRCEAVEIEAYPEARGDGVRCVLLPRLLSPQLRRKALLNALAEIAWQVDGDYVVDRYLAGVEDSLKSGPATRQRGGR